MENVYWILGGIPKKRDRFNLKKKECKNLKAFIFGKNSLIFFRKLKSKVNCKISYNIQSSLKIIMNEILENKFSKKPIILFSPAGASFDNFKNFEERGRYFSKLIKNLFHGKN